MVIRRNGALAASIAVLVLASACEGNLSAPRDGGPPPTPSDAGPPLDAGFVDAATALDAGPLPCPCFLGDGPYCGQRAAALAAAQGCELSLLDTHGDDLLACESGAWSVAEACPGTCEHTPEATELDDACLLPECECFVAVAWCGSGAAEVAEDMGCRIPLLPEHNDAILYCPGGEWAVREACEYGCHSAPTGTPDYCEGDASYRLPFECGRSVRCSSGNHTSNHDGKDEYAYDWAVPRGTDVLAMRGGTVLRVRNVSSPGDACYDGGGSSCANLANTVEVRHDDGTVALYMHLNRGTVGVGARVSQGDVIGRSGNSGWSTGPHLHVQLQRDCGIWWCQSIPLTFAESSSISTGSTVTSENCR